VSEKVTSLGRRYC